jgi:ferritin
MLSKKMLEALNKQINAEYASSYLYLSMAAYFETATLKGFAKWMRLQAKEEEEHALKFFDYINDRGGRVTLLPIPAPPKDFPSVLAVMEATLKHEQKVTSLIHALVDQAIEEKDHATHIFLHWFVEEQVEEEANASEIVEKLKMINQSSGGLLMLDKELGKRE